MLLKLFFLINSFSFKNLFSNKEISENKKVKLFDKISIYFEKKFNSKNFLIFSLIYILTKFVLQLFCLNEFVNKILLFERRKKLFIIIMFSFFSLQLILKEKLYKCLIFFLFFFLSAKIELSFFNLCAFYIFLYFSLQLIFKEKLHNFYKCLVVIVPFVIEINDIFFYDKKYYHIFRLFEETEEIFFNHDIKCVFCKGLNYLLSSKQDWLWFYFNFGFNGKEELPFIEELLKNFNNFEKEWKTKKMQIFLKKETYSEKDFEYLKNLVDTKFSNLIFYNGVEFNKSVLDCYYIVIFERKKK